MTRAKICGVTTREDLEVVVESGADAIGLTVDVPVETPREIDAERAANIVSATPPFVTTVLVTMPDPLESVTGLAERVGPDIVQVHGDSAPEEIASISADLDAGVVVAVSPDDAPRYDTVADALLVDSLDEAGAGGTGSTHDWERTRDLVSDLSSPVVLAGGLTPENVAEAVETVDPFAVDVASGVEERPGRKEPVLVDAVVRHARGHL